MVLRLSQFQLKKLAEYFLTFSQVVLASLILKIFEPGVTTVLDKQRIIIIYSSLIAFAILFSLGMVVAAKVREQNNGYQ